MLTGGGAKRRGERGELGSGLTGARVELRRPGDDGAEGGGSGARWEEGSSVERSEERLEEVRWALGVVLAFYWCRGERRLGVAGAVSAGVNGFNAIEDGRLDERLRREIKGGEMKARW
jgi:hypothetical protein